MFNLNIDQSALLNILNVNMGIKPGESVLVLNDVPGPQHWPRPEDQLIDILVRAVMARQVYDYYREQFEDNKIGYLPFIMTGQHGAEPPEDVAGQMQEYDVVLAMTTYSLSHTRAREEASGRGSRIASMPGLQPAMLAEKGPLAVDYSVMVEETRRLASLLDSTSLVRLESPSGTSLTFSLEDRAGSADTGLLTESGQFGNLPSGEAYAAPVEGTAEGVLVVPAGWHEGLEEDMELRFSGGYVNAIDGGGRMGEQFKALLQLEDDTCMHRRNCAELGIGTNPRAKDALNTLEAEKIRGTVHVAIGDSSHFGGHTESDLHEDFVIPGPTLYLDEQPVLIKGKLEI